MGKEKRFGDIFTNGINYWMVSGTWKEIVCKKCGDYKFNYELRPIVVDENENPKYFVGYYDGKIEDIKPYAKFVKSLTY